MKKLALALMVSGSAMAAPYDLYMNQLSSDGTGYQNRQLTVPNGGSGVDGVLFYNGSTSLPAVATLGSSLQVSSGVLQVSSGSTPVNADWNASSGLAQILNKPTNVSAFTNDSGYITSAALSPYATTAALTSGLGGKFNNPAGTTAQYIRGDGSLATYSPGSGTITSITAGTGLSGGVITTTGTISMPNVGTAGTYSGVTTDAQGRVSAGTTRSQSGVSRSLNSGYQISTTRDALVSYSVQMTVTASIASGQDGDLFLEIASDSGFTTNLQTVAVAPCSQVYTLAVALQGVQKCPLNVSGYVPASYYARLRTANNTGSPAYLYRFGQEVLL